MENLFLPFQGGQNGQSGVLVAKVVAVGNKNAIALVICRKKDRQ